MVVVADPSDQISTTLPGPFPGGISPAKPDDAGIPTRLLVLGMAHRDGTILGSELYSVIETCGVSVDQLRSQLRRLVTEGLFTREGEGRDAVFRATARGRATLIQTPTIPFRALGRLAAAAAIAGAIVLAWFGVVRPELRDAAERAVDDRLDEFVAAGELADPNSSVAPTTVPVAPTATTQPAPIVVGPTPVEYASYRIGVDAANDQERRSSAVVPNGSEFHLTDIVLQNPYGDLGLARLLRDDQVLYEWDLGQMSSANEFQPRISPLPFQPGENIILAVDCEASGRTDGTGCEIGVLLTGALIPLD